MTKPVYVLTIQRDFIVNKRKSSNEVEVVLKRIVVLNSYPPRCNYITMTRACVCIIYAYTRISLEAIARQML